MGNQFTQGYGKKDPPGPDRVKCHKGHRKYNWAQIRIPHPKDPFGPYSKWQQIQCIYV